MLLREKLEEMLGLVPVLGTETVKGAFPTFWIGSVLGLSLLVAPTFVAAKLMFGGSELSSLVTVSPPGMLPST